jgi:DNA processing protein
MTMKTAALDTMHEQHHGLTVDAIARVILSSVLEPGDSDAGKLVDAIGAAETVRAILDTDDERTTEQLRERARSRFSIGGIEQALRAAARFGATLITPEHPHWPTRVNDLGDLAPFALWVRGDSEILTDAKTTAIVGARAATGYGEHITMELAAGLVERGHTIASGAAYGIDGMAHRAALASHGRTIAYLAGGVDRFYPAGHDALLTRIVESGAVVSEVPCGTPPTKWRFIQRNRIVAANSATVIVTEAGWRSGSLNTANHATALGRPVGAVPGPVTSAASAGTHRLIREHGATLITNADEAAEL